ncbi:hypothetical protein GND97_17460, partial [Achromobacter xylosoxidans]|nr:hypothetical protein [Achromobacter xylosoxidans]
MILPDKLEKRLIRHGLTVKWDASGRGGGGGGGARRGAPGGGPPPPPPPD